MASGCSTQALTLFSKSSAVALAKELEKDEALQRSASTPSLRKRPASQAAGASPFMGIEGSSPVSRASTAAPSRARSSRSQRSLPPPGSHEVSKNHPHIYVGRAGWTEADDSPWKPSLVEFNPRLWLQDEAWRADKERRYKQFQRKNLEEGKDVAKTMRATALAEHHKIDPGFTFSENLRPSDYAQTMKKNYKALLDEQTADQAVRAKEARLEELQYAANVRAESLRNLKEEIQKEEDRKRTRREHFRQGQQMQAKKKADTAQEKADLAEYLRQKCIDDDIQADMLATAKMQASQKFAKEEQARINTFMRTAGSAELSKTLTTNNREQKDEEDYQNRWNTVLFKREAGRARQRAQMIKGLNDQMDASRAREEKAHLEMQAYMDEMGRTLKQMDEAESTKMRNLKNQAVGCQTINLQMMLEKEMKEQKEGYRRPIPLATMSQLNCTFPRSSGKDITQRVDAARFSSKPMGRAEGSDKPANRGIEPPITALDISPTKTRRLERTIGPANAARQASADRMPAIGGIVGVIGNTGLTASQQCMAATLKGCGMDPGV
eukprot:gnl/TRDRNA2_/TRDRNA2_186661_c0_seq1.p1 gnl/TRDRNA2_/TRDRNA2_186661_c0~~gnl/TRDRNA2_/TRDRNA2_186661_c0_seq1.p1  ORF type:complete len:552 (-),score=135.68 gnl/TRDRNA2_/TRDRNA2_186661_c0_seq1:124-1779(-)